MTSPLSQYVSLRDAAKLMGVRETTVRNLVVAGGVRGYRCGTSPLRVWIEDIDKLMSESHAGSSAALAAVGLHRIGT